MNAGLRACVCRSVGVCIAAAAACGPDARAQELLDAWDEALTYVSQDGKVQTDLSVVTDLTVYAPEEPTGGLLFTDDDVFVAPRLSAFLDMQLGDRWILHAQMRADRGFDPGLESGGQVRMDEYFVQFRASPEEQLSLRAGKFPTVFGSWAPRSLVWDNPLITNPLPYDDMIPITDKSAPASFAAFAARRNARPNKADWVPIVWGPSYTTGAAVLGRIEAFDYGVEIKNAALSARPETWDVIGEGFDIKPTATVRLGLHPAPEWTLGGSFSQGPYMQESAQPSLPAGTDVDDFNQTTWGVDVAYAHRNLELWSELIYSTFDVPRVGDVDVLSGYVEAKYKISAQLWTALRLNRSWFGDLPGLDESWDRDVTRLDIGLGYRYSRHIEGKFQYSRLWQQGPDTEGNHLFAGQVVVRF
jgi:hypothetical protein